MGKGKYRGHGQQSGSWQGAIQRLTEELPTPGVPTWNGDPELFGRFKQSCAWYIAGLKWDERSLACARVWANLRGSAKLAVSSLSSKSYEGVDGLDKLLGFLSRTPLAKQPLPDAYQKIDAYRGVKRGRGESAATYVLREQEAFDKMMEALTVLRAKDQKRQQQDDRRRRHKRELRSWRRGEEGYDVQADWDDPYEAVVEDSLSSSNGEDDEFFSNEIRGYQLLRNARLSSQEKQTMLAHTRNSTRFDVVRGALITWWENEDEVRNHDGGQSKAFFLDDEEQDAAWDEQVDAYAQELAQEYIQAAFASESGWYGAYWHDDSVDQWTADDWYGDDWNEGEDKPPEKSPDAMEDGESGEVLATSERCTLDEARAAVNEAGHSRQFYSPGKAWSPKGRKKGKKGPKGKAMMAKGRGKGGGKTKDGSCVICGSSDHWWKDCPHRSKGKGTKGKAYWSDPWQEEWAYGYFAVPLQMAYSLSQSHSSKATLDTGATQTAGGITAVDDLVRYLAEFREFKHEVCTLSRPWFHFGDGGWLQALSKVTVYTNLGRIQIYVLDAGSVPILVGSDMCDFWAILISYVRSEVVFESIAGCPKVQLEVAPSGHRLIDLAATPLWSRTRDVSESGSAASPPQ